MGVEPFWTQNTDAIFTSSSMSVHASEALGAPTFAAATWCQNPQPDNSSYGPDIFVETWDLSDVSGNSSWRFHETQISIGTAFQVTMARHAVSSDALAVDLVALESHDFFRYANGSLSPCDAFGFKSRGDGTPAWHFHITNCTNQAILDSLDMGVTMSDDGSLAVFQALLLPANSSGDQSDVPGNNTLVGLDGQTGALRWQITLPIDPHSYIGSVSASAGGNWAAWWVLYATHPIWIVDGVTGAVRATIDSTADWAGVQISDSGDFVVLADDQNVTVLQWDSSAGAYVVQRAFQAPPPLPSKGGNWVCQATAMSSDGSGTATGELVAVGCHDDYASQTRLFIVSVVSGELLADWVSPVQTGYQTDVGAVRFDAGYACAAFWGDDGNIPTMVVLDANAGPAANPILSYTSPGSMYACEVVRDAAASNATHDVVFASFSGKHTPANNGGCGGDAYAFRLDVDVRAHASST